MKIFQEIILCTLFLGVLYSCSSANEEADSSIISNVVSLDSKKELLTNIEKQDDSKLPKTKKMKISIEGMEEEISVDLFESGADFPMPFHVYVPSKYKSSQEKVGNNEAITFTSGPAKLKIISLPVGLSEDDAKGIAKDLVRAKGSMKQNKIEGEKIYYLADEDKEIYTIEVRNINDHYFIIAHEIPVEYMDGFYPRAEMITENIVWKK